MPKKKVSASKKGERPEHWKDEPDEHDFPAAADYLSLLLSEHTAAALVEGLKAAEKFDRKAKDLLRASRLSLLPRGQAEKGLPLLVADGYHRICASYLLDEDADIPCRLVELP